MHTKNSKPTPTIPSAPDVKRLSKIEGGWFPFPNRLLPYIDVLSKIELRVMLAMLHVQSFGPRGEVFCGYAKLAKLAKLKDTSHVARTIKRLIERGIVVCNRRGRGKEKSIFSVVVPPENDPEDGAGVYADSAYTSTEGYTPNQPIPSTPIRPIPYTPNQPIGVYADSALHIKTPNSDTEKETTTTKPAEAGLHVDGGDLASAGDGGKEAELSEVAKRLDELGIRGKKRKEILEIPGITLKVVNHCDSATRTRNRVGMLIDLLVADGARLVKNGIPNAHAPMTGAIRNDDDGDWRATNPQATLDKLDQEEADREGITLEEFRERRRKQAVDKLEQFKKRFSAEQWKYLLTEFSKSNLTQFPSDIAREYHLMQDIERGNMAPAIRRAESIYPDPEKQRILIEFRSGYSDSDWQTLTEAFNKANPMYHRLAFMRDEAPFKMMELVKSGKLSIDKGNLQGVA